MNRHAEGRFIRYGLSFDLDESSNRDAIEDALRAYIQQRQVEMIQALRDMIDQA
jgi:hypothetical protein